MLAGQLALTIAAIFTGAAFYVNFAEQPARLCLDDRSLLAQWKSAYKRGFTMQATLAIFGFLLGLVAAWQTGKLMFVAGSILMIANWPWTIFVMLPTNKAMMATDLAEAGGETRLLLLRWNNLHAVRTCLGVAAVAAFLIALLSR